MKKIWVNIAKSFSDAERFDKEYYNAQTPDERLNEMQFLRDQHFKMNYEANDAYRKGLRRVVRITKQT